MADNNTNIQRKRKRNSKRRQQVRRQLLMIGILILVVIVLLVSCIKKKIDKKEVQSNAVTQQEVETEEERLKRVKAEAKEAEYPEKVIELLSMNPETVDFVEDYGEKKDSLPAETIGEAGGIEYSSLVPKLIQWDERWGYAPYGNSIVAVSGCGPTCMSMVITGLTGNMKATPAALAEYGAENGYVDEENSTLWSFMQEAGSNWGINCKEVIADEYAVAKELEAGHPVICSVGPGDFTEHGHFIVLTSYDDGFVTVCDPFNKKNTEKEWSYAKIESQFKAIWAYYK